MSAKTRAAAAVVAAASLVVEPSAHLVASARQAQAPMTRPPAPTASPAPAQTRSTTGLQTLAIDGGWPRAYSLPSGGSILIYQPQIASWQQQKDIVAYSAVSYRANADAQPALGTIRIEADTQVSPTERLVRFRNMKIAEANFQTVPKDQVREIVATIDHVIPDDDRVLALDRVLANLDKSQIVVRPVEGIKADPPKIFFSTTQAVIVNLDGDPIWSPIRDNDLKFAVNTNWDLFQHVPSATFYLRNDDAWLKAADVTGPWSPAGTLPGSFGKLPDEDNWKEVRANLPGKKVSGAPKVFVSTTPAELILLTGEPKYVEVPHTGLLWVSNTQSDVFRLGKSGPVYYLVAGRWFSAPEFTGPWTFATPSLPPDFRKIPLEHPRSRVLASVPGTEQAAEAVLLAEIPQTARVNKKDVQAPEVAFQGDPQFAPIQQTAVQRAVNTDKDIFKVADRYYMCYQGVWFAGASAAGPWQVTSSVPQEIYQIPPSSPSYHVTYVTVEEDDDDWVTFAAAAGYTGLMIAWGCTVWGTGWYYPPYWGWGGAYPFYYPHFPTYGYSAWYNPWTGAYGRSASIYGPYGGAGVVARYNPSTGTYSRGAAAYGPYGARGVAQAYNPRTGTYAATRQGTNPYASWGSTAVQRGDDWARTNRYTNKQTGGTTRTITSSQGSAITHRGERGAIGIGEGGNIYAGNDGNVYRRQDGTWQKYDNGNWSDTERQPDGRQRPSDRTTTGQPPTGDRGAIDRGTVDRGSIDRGAVDRGTIDQLNRDSAARREGSQRTRDYGSYRSGSGSRGTGSYRAGGGTRPGARGGGRRR